MKFLLGCNNYTHISLSLSLSLILVLLKMYLYTTLTFFIFLSTLILYFNILEKMYLVENFPTDRTVKHDMNKPCH